MTPGIVGDEGQRLVLRREFALFVEVERLSICDKGLDGSSGHLAVAKTELRFLVEEDAHDVEVVVGMLGAVDQRAALYRYHAPIGLHLVVGTYHTRFHVETDDELVALLPAALDVHITISRGQQGYGDAVDDEAIAQTLVVGIAVEVAGYYLTLQPARNADLQVEGAGGVLVDGDDGLAVPGVVGLLRQTNLLACHVERGGVGEEEVQIDVAVFHGIDIAGQRGDEAADVRRTAGAAEPGLTLVLAHRLQGVGVEEAVAL